MTTWPRHTRHRKTKVEWGARKWLQDEYAFWRMKADALRTIAEDTADEVAQRRMLKAAAAYEAMADRAEPHSMGERPASTKK